MKRFAAFMCLFACVAVAQDRMPPIPADKLTPEQKKAQEMLASTPRGTAGNAGPFVPLLRSPELMNRLQAVGEYLRFKNSIPQELVEMSILTVARFWTQQYEWNAHYPLAVKAGLKTDAANAIAEGRRPAGLSDDEQMVWDFSNELLNNKNVSDATYARVAKRFGEQGVVDLAGLSGYYQTLAIVMSVARTPAQADSAIPTLLPYRR